MKKIGVIFILTFILMSCQDKPDQMLPIKTQLYIVEPLSYPTIGGQIIIEDKENYFELSQNPGDSDILQLITPSDYHLESISVDLSRVGVICLVGPGPKHEPEIPDWLHQVKTPFAIRLSETKLSHYLPWMMSLDENSLTTLLLYMCDIQPEHLMELSEKLKVKEIYVSIESISPAEKRALEASQLFEIKDETIPGFYRPKNIW